MTKSDSFDDMEIPRPASTELKLSVFFGNVVFSFGVIFSLMGLLGLVIFLPGSDYSTVSFLLSDKSPHVGGIITNTSTTNTSINDRYVIKYTASYVINDVRYFSNSYSTEKQLKETDSVDIQYLEKDPGVSVIRGMTITPLGSGWWFPIFLLFPASGAWMLIIGTQRSGMYLHLLRYGIRTEGKITNKLDGFISFGESPLYIYCFSYLTRAGKKVQGRTRSTKEFREGVPQYILYDPQDTQKSVLVEALSGTAQKFVEGPKRK